MIAQIGVVRGTIKEKNSPLEFVNVALLSLKDTTKVLKISTTDSSGNFLISNLRDGDYLLKINLIGFLPVRMELGIDSLHREIEIPSLQLKQDGKVLNNVEIITHKDIIKKTPQGILLLAKDNLTQSGGTALDLLRNAPTVVVDDEGGITVRGKSPLILINGRNSALSSVERIPASSIESIEIINNPSAKYDADAEGGIINITLKKGMKKGNNGSFVLGGGYGDFGRVNSSFNFNHSTEKWNIGFAYDNRFAGRTRNISGGRTNFDIPAEYSLIQKRHDDRLEQNQNSKINIDFNPDNKNSFSLELIATTEGRDNDETLVSELRTQTDSFNSKNSRRSIEISRQKVAEVAFTYNRKFKDPKRILSLLVSSSGDFDTENTNITTSSLTDNSILTGASILQRTNNYQNSNVSNLKIDHTIPLGKKLLLESGYKGIARITDADFQNLYNTNGEYILNPRASNTFKYTEQIHAAYLQLKGNVGEKDSVKWDYDLGLRAEQVLNEGKTGNASTSFNRNYINFFPTANLSYHFRQNDFAKLSFSRRINRPDLEELNPFVDITDSLNQHAGNPTIQPELVNAAEVGVNNEFKKFSLSSTLFYRYSTNIIRQFTSVDSNGVAMQKPINFGNAITYGYEGIFSIFLLKNWSMNISASAFQFHIDGNNAGVAVSNDVFSWYGKIINNFTLWKGCKLQVTGNYNAPTGTPQGQKIEIYYVDMGLQQKLFKGKGALGFVVTDVFNTQRSGSKNFTPNFSSYRYSKADTRAVLFTFAYSFGTSFKEELMENAFSND